MHCPRGFYESGLLQEPELKHQMNLLKVKMEIPVEFS
jgi:hypothetical protein